MASDREDGSGCLLYALLVGGVLLWGYLDGKFGALNSKLDDLKKQQEK